MTAPASPNQVLLDLADRCEREEPSRELDALIFSATQTDADWRPSGLYPGRCFRNVGFPECAFTSEYAGRPGDYQYTRSLDAAVTLLAEGCEWELTNLYGIAVASVGLNRANGNWQSGAHKGGHLALALCAAALRARAEALP